MRAPAVWARPRTSAKWPEPATRTTLPISSRRVLVTSWLRATWPLPRACSRLLPVAFSVLSPPPDMSSPFPYDIAPRTPARWPSRPPIIDTTTVVGLLCLFGVIPWDLFYGLVVSGVIFKVMIAFLDTPLLYLFVHLFRRRFGLALNEELDLDF